MDESDLADFTALSDANGEIAKKDLIVRTKASSFWRGYMEAKSKPGSHTSKVRQGSLYYCQTPIQGQTWELTLFSRGNNNKKKKNPHPNSPRRD
jgi:hypothetical protein